jgi:hypothetical protein
MGDGYTIVRQGYVDRSSPLHEPLKANTHHFDCWFFYVYSKICNKSYVLSDYFLAEKSQQETGSFPVFLCRLFKSGKQTVVHAVAPVFGAQQVADCTVLMVLL